MELKSAQFIFFNTANYLKLLFQKLEEKGMKSLSSVNKKARQIFAHFAGPPIARYFPCYIISNYGQDRTPQEAFKAFREVESKWTLKERFEIFHGLLKKNNANLSTLWEIVPVIGHSKMWHNVGGAVVGIDASIQSEQFDKLRKVKLQLFWGITTQTLCLQNVLPWDVGTNGLKWEERFMRWRDSSQGLTSRHYACCKVVGEHLFIVVADFFSQKEKLINIPNEFGSIKELEFFRHQGRDYLVVLEVKGPLYTLWLAPFNGFSEKMELFSKLTEFTDFVFIERLDLFVYQDRVDCLIKGKKKEHRFPEACWVRISDLFNLGSIQEGPLSLEYAITAGPTMIALRDSQLFLKRNGEKCALYDINNAEKFLFPSDLWLTNKWVMGKDRAYLFGVDLASKLIIVYSTNGITTEEFAKIAATVVVEEGLEYTFQIGWFWEEDSQERLPFFIYEDEELRLHLWSAHTPSATTCIAHLEENDRWVLLPGNASRLIIRRSVQRKKEVLCLVPPTASLKRNLPLN
ncbi:MAG: hypothetical protein JSR80_03925 [Verrucomicrobia bacterium]|nr:hypothetical protein [Verrucomicrobiota bacterium]